MPIISGATSSGSASLVSAGVNRNDGGNKTTTSASFADIPGVTATVAAAVGDVLLFAFTGAFSCTSNAANDIGFAVVTSTGGNALAALLVQPHPTINSKSSFALCGLYTVVSGDLSGGNVAVKAQFSTIAGSTLTVYNTGGNDFSFSVVNLRH